MKKLIIGIGLLIVLVVCLFFVYQQTMKSKSDLQEKAINIAYNETNIEIIESVDTYYGTKTYQVISGVSKQGDPIYVWVDEKTKKTITRKHADGVTKEKALQILFEERNPKKVRSVNLGFEKNRPIWEIIYEDEDDRLTYWRSYFETGEKMQLIKP